MNAMAREFAAGKTDVDVLEGGASMAVRELRKGKRRLRSRTPQDTRVLAQILEERMSATFESREDERLARPKARAKKRSKTCTS
jgi:hypothetical protein